MAEMIFNISHTQNHPIEIGLGVWHRVHVAGIVPNNMHRFLLSNPQEVLFVN
jgi:hypothetical protein